MLNAHQNEFQVISSQILFAKFCWQALRSGSFQEVDVVYSFILLKKAYTWF